jgi:hypothetical protein
MECPICGAAAEDVPNTMDGKSIDCPSCGEYRISGTVYDTGALQKLEPEQRRAALGKAKSSAPPGKLPMITSNSL